MGNIPTGGLGGVWWMDVWIRVHVSPEGLQNLQYMWLVFGQFLVRVFGWGLLGLGFRV